MPPATESSWDAWRSISGCEWPDLDPPYIPPLSQNKAQVRPGSGQAYLELFLG